MKINWALLFILAMSVVVINSCTKDKGEPISPDVLLCGDTSHITYTNYVSSVLVTNCTLSGCHTSSFIGFDYTNYAGIKAKVDNGSFQNRVLNLKNMPSPLSTGPTSLDHCTLLKLQAWVNDGAPQ
jgi:hypothetical protein